MTDLTITALLDQTPEEVFRAINNVRGWWSEEIEGSSDTLNAEFLQRYQDVHIAKMKVVEFIPDQRVTWHVLDSHFSFTKDKGEWKDTRICFEISRKNNQTQLLFTHLGLVPECECYDICDDAWNNLINLSLLGLITSGKGRPNPKESKSFGAGEAERWKLNQ
jgi:hypothetical protein